MRQRRNGHGVADTLLGERWMIRAGLCVLAGTAGLAVYADRQGEWPWSDAPRSLSVCDRDFARTDDPVASRADLPPSFAPVTVVDTRRGEKRVWSAPGWAGRCSASVFLENGPDSFVEYFLRGGP